METTSTKLDISPQTEELNNNFQNGLDLLRSPNVLKTKQDYLDVFDTEIIQPFISIPTNQGDSKFTVQFKVKRSLCQNSLCCTFALEITSQFSRTKKEVIRGDDYSQLYYRLAVFDGVKNYDGAATGGLQTCAIIPCITSDLESCGLRSDNLSAVTNTYLDYYQTGFTFDSIEISGNLSSDNSFVGPNVLLKGQGDSFGKLLLPNEFLFSHVRNIDNNVSFWFKTLKSTNIVTASLYGRLFSRDGNAYTKHLAKDSSSLLLNFRFDILIFIIVTLVIKNIL